MNRADIPNLISVFRILLVAPVMWLIYQREFTAALVLFVVAGASDGVDGYLAKRYGWASRIGTILDPLADKLLLMGSYFTLWWVGMLPLWLMGAIILRDVAIVGGALAFHLLIGRFDMAPTLVSKVNTGAQILLVLTILSSALIAISPAVLKACALIVLVTTILSGVDYIWTWSVRALQARRQPRPE